MNTFLKALSLCTLFSPILANSAMANTKQQLLRCMDTQFEQGAYGQYYGQTYHGTDQVCGGDDLGSGEIKINDDGSVSVLLSSANSDPFVMYEVYWIPLGQDPVSHRTLLGNVLTDCNGDAAAKLKLLNRPADTSSASNSDISVLVGNKDAGNFYFYSRGPWGFNDDGSCQPSSYNTSDGTVNGNLGNPALWGGSGNAFFDGVQFISGYELNEQNNDSPIDRPTIKGPFVIDPSDLLNPPNFNQDGEGNNTGEHNNEKFKHFDDKVEQPVLKP